MTRKLIKEFANGIAAVNDVRPQIEFLRKIADVHPEIAEKVRQLISKMEYLENVCTVGTQIAAQMGDQ